MRARKHNPDKLVIQNQIMAQSEAEDCDIEAMEIRYHKLLYFYRKRSLSLEMKSRQSIYFITKSINLFVDKALKTGSSRVVASCNYFLNQMQCDYPNNENNFRFTFQSAQTRLNIFADNLPADECEFMKEIFAFNEEMRKKDLVKQSSDEWPPIPKELLENFKKPSGSGLRHDRG